MKICAILALAAGAMLAISAPASANLILNGDFELPGLIPQNWSEGPLPIFHILVLKGSDLSGVTGSTAAMNNRFAVFGFNNLPIDEALSQNFPTVVGQLYKVSFDAGALGTGTEQQLALTTKAGDGTVLSDLVLPIVAGNNLDTTFANYSFDFTATGTLSTLFFFPAVDQGITGINPILDNVSVTAVPEPATWTFLVIGLGLTGFGLRRRAVSLA
jgi:hypothetical protein